MLPQKLFVVHNSPASWHNLRSTIPVSRACFPDSERVLVGGHAMRKEHGKEFSITKNEFQEDSPGSQGLRVGNDMAYLSSQVRNVLRLTWGNMLRICSAINSASVLLTYPGSFSAKVRARYITAACEKSTHGVEEPASHSRTSSAVRFITNLHSCPLFLSK